MLSIYLCGTQQYLKVIFVWHKIERLIQQFFVHHVSSQLIQVANYSFIRLCNYLLSGYQDTEYIWKSPTNNPKTAEGLTFKSKGRNRKTKRKLLLPYLSSHLYLKRNSVIKKRLHFSGNQHSRMLRCFSLRRLCICFVLHTIYMY